MPNAFKRLAALPVVIGAGAFLGGSALAQGAATIDYALKYCRSMPDAAKRVACYDNVVDEASESGAVAARAVSGPRQAAPASVAEPAQQIAAEEEKKHGGFLGLGGSKKKNSADQKDDGPINTTIARIEKSPHGRMIFVVEDGSKWEQSDSTELYRTPRAGQSMSMTKSAFGNYLCQFGGSQVFNCAPADDE